MAETTRSKEDSKHWLRPVANGMRRLLLPIMVMAVLIVTLSAGPASAQEFRRSWVNSNGAGFSLQFTESGGDVKTMTGIRIAVQLSPSYYGTCAYSRLLIDGMVRLTSGRVCDSDRNGHIVWWLGTFSAYDNDLVTAWSSDPQTRYAEAHPAIRL
jgi:hypothetical protein